MGPRLPALLALAIPVLAGLAQLWFFDAPRHYVAINGASLGLGLLVIALLPQIKHLRLRRIVTLCLLALLFLPLATGPHLGGIARWLPLGPLSLHAGMLAGPLLVLLAARDEDYAPPILLGGILAASFQPDAGTGFLLTFATIGLYNATRDWKIGVVAGTAFFASLVMVVRGELPAQPFVERVLVETAMVQPLAALSLLAALLASFFIMLHAIAARTPVRHALAGSLFGLTVASVLSNYPSALIGYGAAPILGYALALSQCCEIATAKD